MKLDETSPVQNRYLTEGICPACHVPLFRTAAFVAACPKCPIVWRSKRIANIFPEKDGPPPLHS